MENNIVLNEKTMSAIFTAANEVNETMKQAQKRAEEKAYSLNQVCKLIREPEVFEALAMEFAQFDFTEPKQFTLKAFTQKVAPELKKDGSICKVRRIYETEEVQIYRDGTPLCREGKPVTRKIVKLESDGKTKVVKEHKLVTIYSWSVKEVMSVLRMSAKIEALRGE